jgi:hypothetical protein
MQILYRGTHIDFNYGHNYKGLRGPSMMKEACRSLETMIMHIFANFRWRFRNKIES